MEADWWVEARLEELGLARTGAIEQPHVRSWATALRIPTPAVRSGSRRTRRASSTRRGSWSYSRSGGPTASRRSSPTIRRGLDVGRDAGARLRDLFVACQIARRLGWVCRAVNGYLAPFETEQTGRRLRMFLDGGPA